MHRLFVAIDLPENVKEALGDLQVGLPGAGWTSFDTLHLTLRFIGDVDTVQADEIDAALGTVRETSFEVVLAGLGLFGSRRRARILWVGVKPSPPLERLKHKIDAALSGAGVAHETRKFAPHVTLARLAGAGMAEVQAFIDQGLVETGSVAPLADLRVPVTGFGLYSSILTSSGAIHTLEVGYPLA